MSPNKEKHWAKPRLQSVEPSVFKNWQRDKLLQVRELVQRALELVEMSADRPDAAAAIREALDDIDGELAK